MRDSGLPSRPSGALALMVLSLVTLLSQRDVAAQAPDSIPAERVAARQWFRDAKFGMFIHWGVYSLLGQGEWVMQQRELPVGTYEWLATTFNPVKFEARERSEEHTSELQSPYDLVCRLLLEKKNDTVACD